MDVSILYEKRKEFIEERVAKLNEDGDIKRLLRDIPLLEKFARNIMFKHDCYTRFDPWDLINAAYVALFDSEEGYLIDKYRTCMIAVMYEEQRYYRLMKGWGTHEEMVALIAARRPGEILVCRQCHEPMNINGFRKIDHTRFDTICIECHSIINKEYSKTYYGKNKNVEKLKKQRQRATKKYIANPVNKQKHLEKVKAYNELQKQALTDIYIKRLFAGRGIPKCQVTQEMIEAERERIKRMQKQAA
jgi:hypothetical protein